MLWLLNPICPVRGGSKTHSPKLWQAISWRLWQLYTGNQCVDFYFGQIFKIKRFLKIYFYKIITKYVKIQGKCFHKSCSKWNVDSQNYQYFRKRTKSDSVIDVLLIDTIVWLNRWKQEEWDRKAIMQKYNNQNCFKTWPDLGKPGIIPSSGDLDISESVEISQATFLL